MERAQKTAELCPKDLELRTGNTWQWALHPRGASPLLGMKL
jgi:hypothetical protein